MSKQLFETPEVPELVEAAAKTNARMLSLATECQHEFVRFSQARINCYAEYPSRLMECRNPVDVLNLQLEFMAKTQADYMSQFRKFVDNLTGKELEPERSGQDENYGRTILQAQQDAEKIIELAKEQAEHIVAEARERAGKDRSAESSHDKRSRVA